MNSLNADYCQHNEIIYQSIRIAAPMTAALITVLAWELAQK